MSMPMKNLKTKGLSTQMGSKATKAITLVDHGN
jgi:hypothetical protein